MAKSTSIKTKKEIVRIDGKLKEIVTVKDAEGKVLHKILKPLMVEFYPRDALQVITGAALLAIPVGFTEEVWNLGASLPLKNAIWFMIISVLFMGSFIYYNFYRNNLSQHKLEFTKRIVSTYILSFLVVTVLLGMIQLTPWMTDPILAFKRTTLVTFPSSLSAAIVDVVK